MTIRGFMCAAGAALGLVAGGAAAQDGPDYVKQDFGFNGCDVTFGPLMEDTDEDAMVLAARLANAVGFTYHQGLAFGKVIVGPYPAGCKSPSSLSWPLYLAK